MKQDLAIISIEAPHVK